MFQIFLFQIFEFNKFYFHKIIITYPALIIDPHLISKFFKNVTKRYQDYSNLVHSVSSILDLIFSRFFKKIHSQKISQTISL